MKKIAILSAKGGVGKTTLTANLGAALVTEFNINSILIDGNISDANLATHFGICYPKITLNEIIKKKVEIMKAVYMDDYGIRIIPSSLGRIRIDNKSIRFLMKEMNKLSSIAEIIVIDTPPSTKGELEAILQGVDEVIVITTPDIPSISGCIKSLDLADELGKKIRGIVINRVRNRDYEIRKDEIEHTCNARVIASIPEDENILKSLAIQNPAVIRFPASPASIAIKKLCADLLGTDRKFGLKYKIKSWFSGPLKKTNRQFDEFKSRLGDRDSILKS